MDKRKVVSIILGLMILSAGSVFSQTPDTTSLNKKLQELEENVSEIRRDQLNYKIEKDLLKETFSSNYQTLNIVLAIILALFTIVGFFGIRDIGKIRRDYQDELNKLKILREDFETKSKGLAVELEKVKEDYLQIIGTNQEQNKKIRVLEIQENLARSARERNYRSILEFALIGLELDPSNTNILNYKAWALWKTRDLNGAALTYEKMLQIEPENTDAMWNLLEVYLLSNRINEYNEMYSRNKTFVESRDESTIATYFEALKHLQLDDYETMKTLISKRITLLSSEKKKRVKWYFEDVLSYLQKEPEDKKKRLISTYIKLISGDIDKEGALSQIDIIDNSNG